MKNENCRKWKSNEFANENGNNNDNKTKW